MNFSRAAEQLRLTQPAVSHQINSLEDELGAKLFERTSKAVRLTQAGYLFFQYAGDILKLAGMSKARVKEALEQLPGAEDVEVELRPEDGTWQSRLAAAAGERKLTFRTGSFRMGGLVARSAGLGLRVDSSFDSAARDLSGHFAELFGLSLSDE